jgi:hypothetical protein
LAKSLPEFQEQYGKANEIQCEILAADTKQVADTLQIGSFFLAFHPKNSQKI